MMRERVAKACPVLALRAQRESVLRSSSESTMGAVGRPLVAIEDSLPGLHVLFNNSATQETSTADWHSDGHPTAGFSTMNSAQSLSGPRSRSLASRT